MITQALPPPHDIQKFFDSLTLTASKWGSETKGKGKAGYSLPRLPPPISQSTNQPINQSANLGTQILPGQIGEPFEAPSLNHQSTFTTNCPQLAQHAPPPSALLP